MDFFLKLEFNRLIKELDFINSDLFYKSSLLKVVDENFIKNVNEVLETFPQLKQILDEKNQIRFDMLNVKTITDINEPTPDTDEVGEYESKNSKLKNLYRQIAKSTHPDVSHTSENLKEVYLDAQKAYDSNDLIQILSICERLKIEYDITDQEFELIKNEINQKKERIQFLESTYTWRWHQVQTLEEKNKIIINYLETQISK